MNNYNLIKLLNFGSFIQVAFIENVNNYYINDYSIVVNIGLDNAIVGHAPAKPIPRFSSTILKEVTIISASLIMVFSFPICINKHAVEKEWVLLGDMLESYPKDIPLWISPQIDICKMSFDPYNVLSQTGGGTDHEFQVKVNLWFAPTDTHCQIHNQHSFIEIHSQIYGNGRMQRFKECNHQALTEDILMNPGYTTNIPFCDIAENGTFIYPWHQYYSDSDCIWLAVEYHPIAIH